MRNKTARELLKVLKLVFSKDEETQRLGISLFIDNWFLTSFNKYQKFELDIGYKSYYTTPPYWAVGASYNETIKFTKSSFIKFLNSKSIKLVKKVLAIRAFMLYRFNENNISICHYGLKNFLNRCEQDFEIKDSGCSRNFSFKDRIRNELRSFQNSQSVQDIVEELKDFRIDINLFHDSNWASIIRENNIFLKLQYGKNRKHNQYNEFLRKFDSLYW